MDDLSQDRAWEETQRAPPQATIPVLHLDGFDGPMDLLLDLAERQMIDLGKMSILALAEQFVSAMTALSSRVSIEQRADWLVIATRLVLLRARLLYAASPEAAQEAADDAEAELARLQEMALMRAAAAWLRARPQLGQDVFTRGESDPDAHSREGGYVALMEACLILIRGRPGTYTFDAPLTYRVTIPDLWRIQDAIEQLLKRLPKQEQPAPLLSFLPPISPEDPARTIKTRAAIASTFVAGLELAKQDFLTIKQEEHFGDITFKPNPAAA